MAANDVVNDWPGSARVTGAGRRQSEHSDLNTQPEVLPRSAGWPSCASLIPRSVVEGLVGYAGRQSDGAPAMAVGSGNADGVVKLGRRGAGRKGPSTSSTPNRLSRWNCLDPRQHQGCLGTGHQERRPTARRPLPKPTRAPRSAMCLGLRLTRRATFSARRWEEVAAGRAARSGAGERGMTRVGRRGSRQERQVGWAEGGVRCGQNHQREASAARQRVGRRVTKVRETRGGSLTYRY